MINLLYPRMISVHRLKTPGGSASDIIGLAGYSGAEQSTSPTDLQGETILYSCVAATINAASTGRKRFGTGLPGDAVVQPTWDIFPSPGSILKGGVRDRDIVYDDESYRYEVGQAEWNITGYRLICIRVEA